jgi:flagellar protein FlbD
MVRLTRLNQKSIVVNCDLIEHMEVTPDTVITLSTGQKLVVLETAEEVIARIVEFRSLIAHPPVHTVAVRNLRVVSSRGRTCGPDE